MLPIQYDVLYSSSFFGGGYSGVQLILLPLGYKCGNKVCRFSRLQ